MQKEPPPFVWAAPDEKNILTCESARTSPVCPAHRHGPRELHYRTSRDGLGGALRADVQQRGPPDSPFAGGEYHGVLLFPSEYPFKPPGIKVRSSNRLSLTS